MKDRAPHLQDLLLLIEAEGEPRFEITLPSGNKAVIGLPNGLKFASVGPLTDPLPPGATVTTTVKLDETAARDLKAWFKEALEADSPCAECGGRGEVVYDNPDPEAEYDPWDTEECPRCNGTGKEPRCCQR